MMGVDRRLLAAVVVALLIAFGLGSYYGAYQERQKAADEFSLINEERPAENLEAREQPSEIMVYVTGEVEYPNVYRFSPGARVYEALEKAVPKPTADLRYIDLARVMVDEETILVSALGESTAPGGAQSASAISPSGKININRASAAELDQHLSGIGPALAQRIVEYREKNGPFRSIEELRNVSGIGEKRFAEIKDQVDVK